ncbi:Protein phosphatase 1G [Camponotus japonicus]
MGAYLSEPITKKESSNETGKNVAYGASSMQGWRISQEDAHNCCIDFDDNCSLFAVYDGHGGHEVATYCSRYLPDFIKQTEAYKRGDIRQALIDAFLGFDATLTKPEVVKILHELAETSTTEKKEGDNESDEEENVSNLCMEATMPLEQVMAKYKSEMLNTHIKSLKGEKCGKRAFASPFLRGRREREKATCSSLGAGCSSSPSPPPSSSSSLSTTAAWNTNETDVSSSSQPCGSTLSSTVEQKESECPGSNEAEQVLDSTTSNGNAAHVSPPVGSTADVEPAKSMDMPDSSEDVKEKVSSPGKTPPCAESNVNEVEVNGEELKRIGDADSSKGGGDNVSSSSCTPVENGDADQQERITSSGRRRIQPVDLYQSLLKKDSDDSEEDEDDDENDETFDGVPESDEDDTEDIDEDETDDDEEIEEEDIDDSDEDPDIMINIEKPGSDSGCTAVVAILKGNELYVANAGDSRCVLCRDGQAVELSLDHKPEDAPEMERIVKAGGEVTGDGRVNGGLNLSRALGDHSYKQNMVLPAEEQMISALPDVRHITIEPEKDEFMVLACDGIWNFMTSQNVVQFVRTRLSQNYENISKICEELFDHCLAPDTLGDGTGCDNMTAVIVKFTMPATATAKSNTVAEVCVTKKRSISPAIEENNECIAEENTVNSCKRVKTEAAM